MTYFLDNLENYESEIGGHHSNNGSPTEDGNHGVALHIFENIEIQFRYCLDIGAFSSKASNVVPVMDAYKIPRLLLDGENKYEDPKIVKLWITKENIAKILQNFSCPKNFDYISIDIDNMDYWVIKAVLEAGYKSNLLVAEFNPLWSYEESYTKNYIEQARKSDGDTLGSSNYGASLKCFVDLLSKYGYRLVHVTKKNKHGDVSCNNAFFIQSKFDVQNKFESQEKVIKNLFPTPFIESFKSRKNIERFGTNSLEEVKAILKRDWFVEIK